MPVPPVPSDGYVLDQTDTLTTDELNRLNQEITTYRQGTGVQLAVLMVPQISDDDYLERFSLNVARAWGVGQKGKNNGALLLIAKNDRKLRIEVGTGLEGDLTDARSSRIIRERIAPEFRKSQYFAGIMSGIEGMKLAINAKPDPQLAATSTKNGWLGNLDGILEGIFFISFFGISWLGSILGRTKSWWAGGIIGAIVAGGAGYIFSEQNILITIVMTMLFGVLGLMFDYAVSKNYNRAVRGGYRPAWWAGGTTIGGGGRNSGGFGGGFGGGSFGGGGASGSW